MQNFGEGAVYSYFISNANRAAHLMNNFVWFSGVRWAIEQCFEEAKSKSDLGMDHCEVRKFPGWRHHMLTCMLAHFFLWHMRIRWGKKAPAITLNFFIGSSFRFIPVNGAAAERRQAFLPSA